MLCTWFILFMAQGSINFSKIWNQISNSDIQKWLLKVIFKYQFNSKLPAIFLYLVHIHQTRLISYENKHAARNALDMSSKRKE